MAESIREITADAQSNPLDVYYKVYRNVLLPAKEDDKPKLLKQLVEATQSVAYDRDKQLEVPDEPTVEEAIEKYLNILREMVMSLLNENPTEEVFYQRLWAIVKNPFFKQDDVTVTTLLYLLGERITGIPYYQAKGLLSLEQGEYERAIHCIISQLDEGKSMVLRPFKQRTETISQLYRISESIKAVTDADGKRRSADELRIVFWAVMSRIFEAKGSLAEEEE